jgi:hypothetical protein
VCDQRRKLRVQIKNFARQEAKVSSSSKTCFDTFTFGFFIAVATGKKGAKRPVIDRWTKFHGGDV